VRIVVNGEHESTADGTTVADLVGAHLESAKGVAVAVNAEVVPRSTWDRTELREGDRVELLSAAQGG
jgi:sulfur carrier protein